MSRNPSLRASLGWLCGSALFIALPLLAAALPACKREPPPATPIQSAPPPAPAPAAVSAPSVAALVDTRVNNAVPSNRVSSAPPDPASGESSDRADVDITNDVRRAIAGEPTLSSAAKQVNVTTSQGVVQLSGTLPTEADRENLRVAVARVRGVSSIDNRTTVKK